MTNEPLDANFANFVNLEPGVFLWVLFALLGHLINCLFQLGDGGYRLSHVPLPKIHMLKS